MCGPVTVNLNVLVASARARWQASGRSSVPLATGPSTTPGAKAHPGQRAIGQHLVERHLVAHALHRPDEVLDHPVGFGMVDIEAVKLAVADDIDAGLLLGRDDDPGGVDQRLLRRRGDEPLRHRIGADDRRLDARRSAHRSPLTSAS
jgi:hypothetical protein